MQLLMSGWKAGTRSLRPESHVEIAATAHGYMIKNGNIDYLYMFY